MNSVTTYLAEELRDNTKERIKIVQRSQKEKKHVRQPENQLPDGKHKISHIKVTLVINGINTTTKRQGSSGMTKNYVTNCLLSKT